MQQLNFGRDVLGQQGFFPYFSIDTYRAILPANTVKSLTVPTNAIAAFIAAEGDYYVDQATVTVPANADFTKENGACNKPAVNVSGVSTLYFIAPVQTRITVEFYAAPYDRG